MLHLTEYNSPLHNLAIQGAFGFSSSLEAVPQGNILYKHNSNTETLAKTFGGLTLILTLQTLTSRPRSNLLQD